jgi:hypothetical protein
MPALPPVDAGSGTASGAPAATPTAVKPGDAALTVAIEQLGKPYVYSTAGPDTFDCSGLIYYSYLQGANLNVGRDTTAQWNNTTVLTTIVDAYALGTNTGLPTTIDEKDLEYGDIILYFQPGNSGENAHVKMYAGGGQTIEAPHTGDVVKLAPLDLVGSASEPFRGIKRALGGGTGGGGTPAGGGNDPSQGNGQQTPTASGWDTQINNLRPVLETIKDPTSNLPFSAYFLGQKLSAGLVGTGGLTLPGLKSGFMPSTQLVRGGMVELIAQKFKCYFMMNPQQISGDCGINTDQTSPLEMDPTQAQTGGAWVTNENISFTVYFNRMYEVWHGGVPGPSDIGCRWDIRALERLMGIFDAVAGNTAVGEGSHGAGSGGARTMLCQVAFGGPNALQFQGTIASFDYVYTLFDVNMIPIEAYADISVMRIYMPSKSSAPLTSSLVTRTGQVGGQILPQTKGASGPTQTFSVKR